MLPTILEIARHEIFVALRTRRAMVAMGLYLGVAILGGLAYVMAIRTMEQQAVALMLKQGLDPSSAASAVSLAGNRAYEEILGFFVGAPIAEIAPALTTSPVIPVFMWGTLAFLPYLILLSSFDHVVNDLRSRSVCYTLLRAPRTAILLGKTLAQATLFIGVMTVSLVVLVSFATLLLSSFSPQEATLGILRAWIVLIPFGLCYLGIVTFASTVARQPFGAITLAFTLLICLNVIRWVEHLPHEHWLNIFQPLRWLSPGSYETGLWLRGIGDPLTSSLCYMVIGAAFVLLAIWRLGRRDL